MRRRGVGTQKMREQAGVQWLSRQTEISSQIGRQQRVPKSLIPFDQLLISLPTGQGTSRRQSPPNRFVAV